eukprot:351613-Chlamydomonas_euryale.AAC.6
MAVSPVRKDRRTCTGGSCLCVLRECPAGRHPGRIHRGLLVDTMHTRADSSPQPEGAAEGCARLAGEAKIDEHGPATNPSTGTDTSRPLPGTDYTPTGLWSGSGRCVSVCVGLGLGLVRPSVGRSVRPSIGRSVRRSVGRSVRPSVRPSVGPFVCLSVRLGLGLAGVRLWEIY